MNATVDGVPLPDYWMRRALAAEAAVKDAARLLMVATAGRGIDPIEYDRRVSDWLIEHAPDDSESAS